MSRLPFPTCTCVVVSKAHGEVLHQTVKRNCTFGTERAASADFLGRKHIKEEAEVRHVMRRGGAEVPRRSHGDRELRKHVTTARDRKGLARQTTLTGQQ